MTVDLNALTSWSEREMLQVLFKHKFKQYREELLQLQDLYHKKERNGFDNMTISEKGRIVAMMLKQLEEFETMLYESDSPNYLAISGWEGEANKENALA